MGRSHWVRWHDQYDDPGSTLRARLAEVQRQLGAVLDAVPSESRLIAMCAGRGRDVLDVLKEHPRGRDVRARLVELDPELAGDAAALAQEHELGGVEVVCGDASWSDAYEGAVPADIEMVCGVFGNITIDDIAQTVAALASLCAPGARVIWTRHRREPDRSGEIRAMFRASGFREVVFAAPEGYVFSVATSQLERAPEDFAPGVKMFSFVGDGADAG